MAEPVEEADVGGPDLAAPGSDGLAAALIAALGRRGDGAKADPEFETFLRQQTRLSELQTEHLHEQRTVILSNLKLRRINEWMKAALQALTMLVGLGIVIAIAIMAWQAHEDHGVAIQAFSVPPDFAQRGMTGQVVASQLLDRLSELQAQTATYRPASTYADDWGDDIKVEIPEAGVSLGELNRYLRQWLGSETQITGSVIRTPAGIAVTARTANAPARRFEGPEADVDNLINQAAEAAYAETQPYRYAAYLDSHGHTDQALQAYARLADSGAPEDRAWAYTGWAGLLFRRQDPRGALVKAAEAIRIDRRIAPAYAIQMSAFNYLGRWADAVATSRAALRASDSGHVGGMSSEIAALRGVFRAGVVDPFLGDYGASLAEAERMNQTPLQEEGGGSYDPRNIVIDDLVQLHDISAAIRQYPSGSPPRWDARVEAADTLDDWGAALSVMDSPPATASSAPEDQAERAVLLARLGRIAEAEAAIAPTPLDCTACLLARGEIAADTGDRMGADRWFSEAVKQAALPNEYLAWGRSLLFLRDPDAAIVELKQAHEIGPHYADPLEVWGEALMAKRDYAGTIEKFAEADKDAPKWGRNHLRWGEALMLSGRYAEARAQYETANNLDLSKPDRAALNVLLARTAKGPLHG